MSSLADNLRPSDRDQAVALVGDSVSRETWTRLDRYVELLLERQRTMNLIADSTIPTLWTRHVADSLQLLKLAPKARRWIDLGAGAGFPSIPIACALVDKTGTSIHLIESRKKKAAFLGDVARALQLPALVHAVRIEEFLPTNGQIFDVVTARALAPLERLIAYAIPLLKTGAVGLFPKGQDVEAELTQASKSWRIEAELVASVTDPKARVIVLHSAVPR